MAERICVGAIAGAFGVRGEVRIKSFCVNPLDIRGYSPLTDEQGGRAFTITQLRPIKDGLGARIEGVETRDAAEALRGQSLWVLRDRLPSLPDDEFYHADLIGLEVLDTAGQSLGHVQAIYDHGAGDIIEVKGVQTLLLPFTRAVVPTVDLRAGRLIADPPGHDE